MGQHERERSKSTLFRISIGVALFAIVAAVVLLSRGHREPDYKGKTLGEWVTLNARRSVGFPAGGGDPEEALRHFGTNALPFLIRSLQYQRPPWKAKVWSLVSSLPVSKSQRRSWSHAMVADMMRANDAVSAFHTLGDSALPAVPELTQLMFRATDEQVSRRAMQSLAGIGTASVPALTRALTNFAATSSFRDNAAEALAEMEMQALPAVPVLLQWLNDKNKAVVSVAVTTLGELQLWPNIVVPALTNKLGDLAVRLDVIEALGSFEKDAAAAIPQLLGFLTDTNAEIVAGAASALGDIGEDPEVVTPALAKLLTHENESVRGAAIASLYDFGEKARPAIPIIRAAMEHPNQQVRAAAASVLQTISAGSR
jgi:HEAT repeat protein